MPFDSFNIKDADWGNYKRITGDTQYPSITAQTTDTPEFSGAAVVTNKIRDRFAKLTLGDTRKFATKSTNTAAAISTTSVQVASAAPDRKGLKLYNHTGGSVLFIHEGPATTASISNATAAIAPGEMYMAPAPVWTGTIYGITAAGTAQVAITDYSLLPSTSATDAGFSFTTTTTTLAPTCWTQTTWTNGSTIINRTNTGNWPPNGIKYFTWTATATGNHVFTNKMRAYRPTQPTDSYSVYAYMYVNGMYVGSQDSNGFSGSSSAYADFSVTATGVSIGDSVSVWVVVYGSVWADSYPTLYWTDADLSRCV